ncbi:hypothetical protein TWF106_005301 [Orbilia oligospora]|uniref:chitinase n=1 Tax=Orbilia oligospora TaxID=2813651 RepID=A0A7C8UMW1_ORBOL|nr:hypothetical protein TWF106_005301 [Orbilia oligospora]
MRPSSPFSLLATGLITLISSWAVDAYVPTDIVVYYGQGSNQDRLREFCDSTSIQYISIGFVTKFRNTGLGGVIETNFGNQGFAPASPGTNYVYNCPYLQEDIPYCQTKGKKILISIGGGAPENSYYLTTESEAQDAADDIWSAFGPKDPNWSLPRPFGDAIVDGFDLDLETGASKGDNGAIYASFAQRLRDKFQLSSNSFLLTAAPQCIYPDATLGNTLSTVSIDLIFVQFYNNPSCRPSNLVKGDADAQKDNFNKWNSLASNNPNGNCKWFLGLLASPSSADYTSQTDLVAIRDYVQVQSNFGGIMLWEATSASRDVNEDGFDYIDRCKSNLEGNPLPDPTSTASPSTTTMPFAVTSTAPPGETHLAIVPECNQWHFINAGDSCAKIVEESQGTVTQAQLEEWNEAARNGCSSIWANTWLCVGVDSGSGSSTTAPPSTTTASPFGTTFPEPPAQTQPGVAPDCTLWHLVKDNDNCEILAAGAGNGVTYQNIITWNPAVGQSCTNLWLNYYACIGVPGSTSTTSSTTTTSTPSTTSSTGLPSPTQEGFPADCDSWHIAKTGEYCSIFATNHGITLEELLALNPALEESGCSAFWLLLLHSPPIRNYYNVVYDHNLKLHYVVFDFITHDDRFIYCNYIFDHFFHYNRVFYDHKGVYVFHNNHRIYNHNHGFDNHGFDNHDLVFRINHYNGVDNHYHSNRLYNNYDRLYNDYDRLYNDYDGLHGDYNRLHSNYDRLYNYSLGVYDN